MTKTKIALAAVLFAATSSAALAQGFYDPNLANRYPAYAEPNTYGYSATGKLGALHAPQSGQVNLKKHSNVRLQAPGFEQRDVALPTTGAAGSNDWFEIERSDRASSPYAGGN
jgi:hypothetical protein